MVDHAAAILINCDSTALYNIPSWRSRGKGIDDNNELGGNSLNMGDTGYVCATTMTMQTVLASGLRVCKAGPGASAARTDPDSAHSYLLQNWPFGHFDLDRRQIIRVRVE